MTWGGGGGECLGTTGNPKGKIDRRTFNRVVFNEGSIDLDLDKRPQESLCIEDISLTTLIQIGMAFSLGSPKAVTEKKFLRLLDVKKEFEPDFLKS